MNWFIFSVGGLQMCGAIQYLAQGKYKFAVLYMLYALTNFVLFACIGE